MKQCCFVIAWLCLTATAPAQSKKEEVKCFPSGYSLDAAYLIDEGEHIMVRNTLGLYKIFDKRGNLLSVRDLSFEDWNKMTSQKQTEARYKAVWDRTKNDAIHISVSDAKTNKEISSYTSRKEETNYQLNKETGFTIVYSSYAIKKNDEVVLLKPNGKEVTAKIKMLSGDQWKGPEGADIRVSGIGHESYFTFSATDKYVVNGHGDLFDVEGKTVYLNALKLNNRYIHAYKYRIFSFNAAETELTMIDNNEATVSVFNLATRTLIKSSSPSEDVNLPKIDGFEILQGNKPGSYLYWMKFDTKVPVSGLAYWVEDKTVYPLCDPNSKNENFDNLLVAVKKYRERDSLDRIANKKKEEEENARKLAEERRNEKTSDPEMNLIIATAIAQAKKEKMEVETEYYFYKVVNKAFGFKDKAFVFEAEPDADYIIQVITRDADMVEITGKADDGLTGGIIEKSGTTLVKGCSLHSYVWSQKNETGQVSVTPYKSSTTGLGAGDPVKAYIIVYRFTD